MGTLRDWFAGRWLSGAVALLGVLLVVPSLFAPTWEMSVSDREHGSLLSRQWEWSWGRVRVTGLEGVELRDQWNPLGLAVLVVLLVAALGGVAGWAARRVGWGRVVGLATIGLLAGRVLTTASDRVGRALGEIDQGASGLSVRTGMTQAGSLETVAAVVLVVALVLMVVAASRSTGGPVRPAAPAPTAGTSSSGSPSGRPEAAGLRPAGEHLTTSPVSFDDADPGQVGHGQADPAASPGTGR